MTVSEGTIPSPKSRVGLCGFSALLSGCTIVGE
jgi:hypothetical protein